MLLDRSHFDASLADGTVPVLPKELVLPECLQSSSTKPKVREAEGKTSAVVSAPVRAATLSNPERLEHPERVEGCIWCSY